MSNIIDKIDYDAFEKATKKIKERYNISEPEAEKYLMSLGPKALKNMRIFSNIHEWREGHTKQTIVKRKSERRKKNKISRQTRRKQCK